MRILLIGSVFPRSATDDQVPWLLEGCRHIAAAGHTVEVLAPSHRGLRSHTIHGITVHRWRYAPAAWETLTGEEGAPAKLRRNPWLKFMAVCYLFFGFFALFGLLLRRRYDLVEVHWPFPHAFMALPAVWAGIPVVYHYHSAELKLAAQSRLSQRIFALTLPWARAHIANSSYTAALVQQLSPGTSVSIIPYGSPLVLPAIQRSTPTGVARRLLFVGRHIQRKGITYLIQALAHLPAHYTLTIVGVGDQTPALQAQAAPLNTQAPGRITFTGRLSSADLAQAYASHDIFVCPSIVDSSGDTEGLGVVLIEAIAAGMPIVASNVGGIPDVIIDGHTGLLVPPADAVALAAAIDRLGRDPALVAALAAAARQHAQESFSWPAVTTATLAVYGQAIASRPTQS